MQSADEEGKTGTGPAFLLDEIPAGVAVVDAKRVVRFANRAAGALLDPASTGIEGTVFGPAIVPGRTATAQIRRPAGGACLVELDAVEIAWEGERAFLVLMRDVTEPKRAELLLRQSEERCRSLLEASSEGIVILSGTEILDHNGALEVMTGAGRQELVGRDVLGLLAEASREPVRRALASGQVEAIEAVCIRQDGARLNVQVLGKPHTFRGRAVTAMILRDITELAKLREKLVSLSHTDELTGLSNRRGFQFLAYQQMKLANRSRKGLLLIFLDLDNMKWINDTLGHVAGDRALIETAEILRETMRKSDVVARIGGDEFVVMAIEAQPGSQTIILERLGGVLERVNARSTRGYDLSFSFGTAYYSPDAPSSLEALMGEADELMYEEKKKKKSRRP